MMRLRWIVPAVLVAGGAMGCSGEPEHETEPGEAAEAIVTGTEWLVRDTVVPSRFDASGVARPIAEATLSTKLMGEVVGVPVREGDGVTEGQPLVRIDASDLVARRAQVEASIREAEAVVREAETQAARMRTLYAEDAAPKVQLDAAETGLERARARLETARAAAAEVAATARYAVVRAPFDGVVTARFVDPGDFAAPGAPMATVLDAGRLRIVATAAPDVVTGVARGDTLEARIEGERAIAVVEGVVPSAAGQLYTVNAVVDNSRGHFLPGSAAVLQIPRGTRTAILVPASAIVRRGDLTGVRVRALDGAQLRWIRLGDARGEEVEVLAGLEPGEVILVPAGPTATEGGAGVASGSPSVPGGAALRGEGG
ncbi:MAG: efflux RND transporter periplasmic adaptor subunit [Gemmatimonadota bacterium]|jgi:RND family efflux transporter MFP subunit